MDLRIKISLLLVYSIVLFAVGRYSVQSPKTQVKTQELQVETEKKDVHTKKTITEVDNKDGSKTITFVTDQIVSDSAKHEQKIQVQETVTPPKLNTLNISVLGGNDFSRAPAPTYGLSVNKQLLGPITLGLFGLKSGIYGVSIGVNF